MVSLKDSIVCVTGASLGIGRSCAHAFAAQGARLIICSRRGGAIAELAVELRATHGVPVLDFELDVRDRNAVMSAVAGLPAEWSGIDVLVNNAGLVRGLNELWLGDFEDWDEMIDTNVKG